MKEKSNKSNKKPRISYPIKMGIILFSVASAFLMHITNKPEHVLKSSPQGIETDAENGIKDSIINKKFVVSNEAEIVKTKEPIPKDLSKMEVHFIDVGQGDSILIESAGEYMLIDAGDNSEGINVLRYLKKEGVETLKYVIGTHPHSDHIGGVDQVIDSFEVKKIILPNITNDTQTFEDVLAAISNKGLKITTPKVGNEYSIGNAKFTIIAPNGTDYSNLNNYSVGIKLENGNNAFVMCGDAELEAEYDILDSGIDVSADVLKLGHHGSDTATSEAILKAVNPSYAIISVGINNKYGHPFAETLQKIFNSHIKLFRTDMQGGIIAISDGKNITFNTEPTEVD